MKRWLWVLSVTLSSLASACDNASPTLAPTPAVLVANGRWTGALSDGSSITFTVSPDRRVTELTIGYRINDCVGTQSFSGISVEIVNFAEGRAARFEFSSSEPYRTLLSGNFFSPTSASGSVLFVNYPGCGNGGGAWTATMP